MIVGTVVALIAFSIYASPCAGYLGHPFRKIENKQISAQ